MMGILLICIPSITSAQDLIKNTQLGLNAPSNNSVSNRIAQQVAEAQARGKFQTVSLFELSGQELRTTHENYITGQVYLDIQSTALETFFNARSNTLILDIPVNARQSFQLELVQVNIFAPDFQVVTSDGNVLYDTEDIPGVFYRGIVKGNPNSIATLSVFKDHIRAVISDDYGNYVLGQTTDIPNTYILYNDRYLKLANEFECDTPDDDTRWIDEQIPNYEQNRDAPTGNCIDIYIEADYDTYQSFNNSTFNVTNYVSDLFSHICTIYANESINIQLSQLFIWTSIDPFAFLLDTEAVLDTFVQKRQVFNGDLAHLISTRRLGGGRARIDVLCNANDGDNTDIDEAHAVSGNLRATISGFPTYSWDIYVFAHELGHNFGSRHTHACVWNGNNTAIDGCGNCQEAEIFINSDPNRCNACPNPGLPPANTGTIMSYCHARPTVGINFNNGFGQQPGDLIRDRYNNADCKSPCGSSDNCPTDLTHSGTISPGLYEASNSIVSTATIGANQSVTYDAGGLICLNPGFIANSGNRSDFLAHIDGCDGMRVPNGSKTVEPPAISFAKQSTIEDSSKPLTSIKNIPNPFSEQTTFQFELPEASKVHLEIYDVSGKVIAVLMNGEMVEQGQHQIQFDAADLPNGVYIYRLSTEQESITKKMVLRR